MASAFLGYPHFIGTVTAFVDRFIALPYLRGLGWSIQRIDDEVFEAIAGSRWRSKPTLTRFAYGNRGRNAHAVERWVSGMELADDVECAIETRPERLRIRNKDNRQPGAHTASGAELEELKAEIVNEGFYRFADMTALAHQAIENSRLSSNASASAFRSFCLMRRRTQTGHSSHCSTACFAKVSHTSGWAIRIKHSTKMKI